MPARGGIRNSKIIFWNAAGSTVYALSSFLLLLIVTRAVGADEAGIFSIGYAIAQLMLTIGVFEATTYFATDVANRFSSEQYLAFKLLTCALMALASVVYTMSFGFDLYKQSIALALCAFRLLEALDQFWYAAFQKEERLDIAGFSTVCRMGLAIAAFAVVCFVFEDVFWAIIIATVMEGVWIVLYDMRRIQTVHPISRPDFDRDAMLRLFLQLLPLFAATFLANYLTNAPKYAIEAMGTESMQTMFNVLFMPSFVVNLFMIFVMRPALTTLAARWNTREYRGFARITASLLVTVVGITLVVLVAMYLVGIPLLELFFGVDLDGTMVPMLLLIVGGGLSSGAAVLYNDMVIIRHQAGVVASYVIAVAVAVAVADPLVSTLGLAGAAWAYVASTAALLVSFLVIFLVLLARAWRKQGIVP